MTSRRKGAVASLAVLLAGAAFAVALTTPDGYVGQEPFVVAVETGERGTGRDIEARFDTARLAREVQLDDWSGGTTGVWVVVDAQFSSVLDDKVPDSVLEIGDRSWVASSRPPTGTLQSSALSPRMPLSGVVVFEIPEEALEEPAAREARVRVAGAADPRLDSVIEWTVDLSGLDVAQTIVVQRSEAASW